AERERFRERPVDAAVVEALAPPRQLRHELRMDGERGRESVEAAEHLVEPLARGAGARRRAACDPAYALGVGGGHHRVRRLERFADLLVRVLEQLAKILERALGRLEPDVAA